MQGQQFDWVSDFDTWNRRPRQAELRAAYSDPEVFTAPWTIRVDWNRDEDYEFFEYACHEENVQVRNYINSSRAARGATTSLVGAHDAHEHGGADATAE